MAWIESHDELPTHPKTAKLARRIGTSKPAAVGHLHFLWWWCLTHRPDGWLRNMDADDIADAAGWEGDADAFVAALADSGWLDYDQDVGDYFVHDWWDGAGKTIKRRKFATERQRKARDADGFASDSRDSHGDVTRDTHASHGADSDSDSDRDKKPKSGTSSRKRADRATRLPDGWTPKPEPDLIKAVGGQHQADRQLDRFRDYWTAQPGTKGRKVDWQATWRNWLRRTAEDRQPRGSPEPPRATQPVVGSAEWEARQREQAERERLLLGDTA